jgi:acyl-coenzyme A thioesterase PaaI-like protein
MSEIFENAMIENVKRIAETYLHTSRVNASLPDETSGLPLNRAFENNLREEKSLPQREIHQREQVFFKPLSLEPDEEDLAFYKINSCPQLVSRRLRELVPLLEVVDCIVEEISPEKTVLSVPLLPSAMNQNGTHQAAVFYLVADYTIGVGMYGVLPGCYVTAVHDRCHGFPVQYWLKRGSVTHLAPGTGRLRAEVRISPDDALKLRRQLIDKGRGELSETVRFYQGDQIVAEASHTMGIYADIPRIPGERANIFQVQNMKTSALMIAGLRGDAISLQVAREQGRAIASRMSIASPQLPGLVNARGINLEHYLEQNGHKFSQVLVLGVGLDPKPVRFSSNSQKWFGVDLRDMLKERESRFATVSSKAQNFVPIAADLLSEDWEQAILQSGYDPDLPTFIIAEGLSMYFSGEALTRIFCKLRRLTTSDNSRFWVDHVTNALFDLDLFEVKSFLSTMTRLGEPFVLGFENANIITPEKWVLDETTSAASVLGTSDAVYSEYRFSVLKPV